MTSWTNKILSIIGTPFAITLTTIVILLFPFICLIEAIVNHIKLKNEKDNE